MQNYIYCGGRTETRYKAEDNNSMATVDLIIYTRHQVVVYIPFARWYGSSVGPFVPVLFGKRQTAIKKVLVKIALHFHNGIQLSLFEKGNGILEFGGVVNHVFPGGLIKFLPKL